jgi:hypothetical protein
LEHDQANSFLGELFYRLLHVDAVAANPVELGHY